MVAEKGRAGVEEVSLRQEDARLKLPASLRPYQRDGVAFLLEREAALLADQMGLGKTVQAAVALQAIGIVHGWFRSLVVCPASLRLNWQRELERWAPGLTVRRVQGDVHNRSMMYRLPVQVLIASYDQIRLDARSLHPSVDFEVVVLDEAQRIKNIASETNLSCRLLPRSRAWALTGTPLENKPDELVAIFRFLGPGILQKHMARSEIHERIKHHFLRRRKADVLQSLPPIQVQEIDLELSSKQQETYLQVWRSRGDIAGSDGRQVPMAGLFALLTKLKQICNFDPDSGESAKYEALQTFLEALSEPDDKMLLFSQYVRTLKWLAARIKVPCGIFHGGLSDSEKEQVLKDFNDKEGPRVLLMSLRAGGTGLNIQSASTVVLFDRWWNPAVEQQAIERAHRFGRERPLYVVKMLVVDTVEERIAEVLEQKGRLFQEYVEGAPVAQVKEFTRKELYRILQL